MKISLQAYLRDLIFLYHKADVNDVTLEDRSLQKTEICLNLKFILKAGFP